MIYKNGSYPPFSKDNQQTLARFKYGMIENNLLFNYLDYLVWREAKAAGDADEVIESVKFTLRSSVAHFRRSIPWIEKIVYRIPYFIVLVISA